MDEMGNDEPHWRKMPLTSVRGGGHIPKSLNNPKREAGQGGASE